MNLNLNQIKADLPSDAVAVEISGIGKKAIDNLNNGLFNIWATARINKAFNYGSGCIKNLKSYAFNNKKHCTIIFL